MKLILAVLLLTLTGCTTPCPKLEPRYVCPADLGTTWVAEDANGCTRYVCSVGGRGGFVEGP